MQDHEMLLLLDANRHSNTLRIHKRCRINPHRFLSHMTFNTSVNFTRIVARAAHQDLTVVSSCEFERDTVARLSLMSVEFENDLKLRVIVTQIYELTCCSLNNYEMGEKDKREAHSHSKIFFKVWTTRVRKVRKVLASMTGCIRVSI